MKSLTSLFVLSLCTGAAMAHVSLDAPRGEAGSRYQGVLRVGHGCDGAATTAIDVRLPSGVSDVHAAAKPGWKLVQTRGEILWTADSGHALPAKEKGEFPIDMQLPKQAGPLWLKVLQRCEGGAMDWADVPAQGTSTEGMKTPAVLLEAMSPADFAAYKMLPSVEGGWVRAAVPGQQATGAFMRITAKEPMQLVGASTPVAGIADVHEMKMEGDVMHMRPAGAIELPVGRAMELKPGGYHVMLQDLKKPLESGSTVPITLVFRDARGKESRLELKLPVALQAPGAPAAGMTMEHKH
jgi:copper(I)-binding protein